MVLSIDACPAEGPDYPFGWNFEPKWIDFVLRHGAFCLHWRWAQYCGRDRQHDCRRNDDAIADFSVHIRPHFYIRFLSLDRRLLVYRDVLGLAVNARFSYQTIFGR